MLPAFGAEEEKEWLGKAACPRAAGCSQPQPQVLLSRREEPRRTPREQARWKSCFPLRNKTGFRSSNCVSLRKDI